MEYALDDETIFGDDTVKVRQLLGTLSIVILDHKELLADLLDQTTFIAFYQNQAILENLSYWFTDPSFKIEQRNKEVNYVINVLKAFIKRVVNKNIFNGIVLNVSEDGVLKIFYNDKKAPDGQWKNSMASITRLNMMENAVKVLEEKIDAFNNAERSL